MPIKGLGAIDLAIEQVSELADELEREVLATAPTLVRLTKQTHRREQDPYGQPWKPRKGTYGWPINDRTGRLLASYRRQAHGDRVTIRNTAPHASFVNDERQLLPDDELPDVWLATVEQAVAKMLKRRFK